MKMWEEMRFCYLPQNLIQNICFLTIQYDDDITVFAHELILTRKVLCS